MLRTIFDRVSLRSQVIAFLISCCMGVTALVLAVGSEYDHLTVLAEQLNEAGRLRMLSQRTLLEVEAVRREEPGAIEVLQRTWGDFEQVLVMQLALQRSGITASDGNELEALELAWQALKSKSETI